MVILNTDNQEFEFNIINFAGNIIYSGRIYSNYVEIDLSKYPNGIYLMQFINNKEIFSGKVVKQR